MLYISKTSLFDISPPPIPLRSAGAEGQKTRKLSSPLDFGLAEAKDKDKELSRKLQEKRHHAARLFELISKQKDLE